MTENNILIEKEDINVFAEQAIRSQMAQYGQPNPSEEEIQTLVKKVLENREEREKIVDYVRSQKLHAFYKSIFKINENKWKSMKSKGNQRKSMKINEKQCNNI